MGISSSELLSSSSDSSDWISFTMERRGPEGEQAVSKRGRGEERRREEERREKERRGEPTLAWFLSRLKV